MKYEVLVTLKKQYSLIVNANNEFDADEQARSEAFDKFDIEKPTADDLDVESEVVGETEEDTEEKELV